MKSNQHSNSQVVFTNEPKLSEYEVDNKFNERRLSLLPHVKEFILMHELFNNETAHVTFATRGISSLISIIDTTSVKVVLKITLNMEYSAGESQFLKAWEETGVLVPHVIEAGTIDGNEYTLMEYIDAPILSEKYSGKELLQKEIYSQMGHTLKIMHSAVTQGYGRVVEGQAEFATFIEWIDSEDIQRRIEYVKKHTLLNRQHGTFEEIRDVLIQHTQLNPVSSYCHDDFGGANIFATEPITVFDPNPRFNNGYIDLGRSLMIHIANGGTAESQAQLITGYFGESPCDQKALYAAIVLAAYMKFAYWHKTKKTDMIERAQAYFIENRYLLNK